MSVKHSLYHLQACWESIELGLQISQNFGNSKNLQEPIQCNICKHGGKTILSTTSVKWQYRNEENSYHLEKEKKQIWRFLHFLSSDSHPIRQELLSFKSKEKKNSQGTIMCKWINVKAFPSSAAYLPWNHIVRIQFIKLVQHFSLT